MSIFNRKKLSQVPEELLDEYYQIDGNKANFSLNFKTIDDIVDETFIGHKSLILEQDFEDKLKEYIALLPKKYELTININIEDTQGHSIDEIKSMFQNNTKLNKFKRLQSNSKKTGIAIAMTIVGSLFFLFYALGVNYNWWAILVEFLDIACWVFYWEAATIVFIDVLGENSKTKILQKRTKQINITNNKIE